MLGVLSVEKLAFGKVRLLLISNLYKFVLSFLGIFEIWGLEISWNTGILFVKKRKIRTFAIYGEISLELLKTLEMGVGGRCGMFEILVKKISVILF